MAMDFETDRRVRKSVLVAAVISAFLTPFMGSAINLALPAMGVEFGINAILLGWIATSYLLSSAVFLLPFGRLADIYGRRKVFLIGMAVFTISSFLCSLAPGIYVLLLFRVMQGMGSAMIFATGIAIVTSVFPPGERGKAFGYTIAAVYTGLSFGPFAGGLLTDYLGWRSIFLFTTLMGITAIYFIILRIKGEWAEAKGEPFDLEGSLVYGASLFLLIFGFTNIPGWTGFGLLAAGSVGVLFFIRSALRNTHPVMQLRLFQNNPVFAMSNLAALINYSATAAVAFILSLYLQYSRGFSPRDAGLILVVQPVVMAVVSLRTGRLSDRIEPRLLSSVGMAITSLGLFLLIFVDYVKIPVIMITLIILGTGFGFFSSPNSNAIMSSVDKRYYGIASGTMGTMRLIGQIFSMGIVMLILSLFIGREAVIAGNMAHFIQGIQTTFIFYFILCFLGVFISYSRGRMHRQEPYPPD